MVQTQIENDILYFKKNIVVKNETIVVVDDESDIREIIEFHLTKKGYIIYTFETVSDALHHIKTNKPSLVVSDWMMPYKNGLDFLHEIKNDCAINDVAFIMMTARNDEESVAIALQSGADDYISKPIPLIELNARIEKVLIKKKHIQKLEKINEDQNKLAARYEEIIASIAYAKQLQMAMLPSLKNFKLHFANSSVFFQPKDIVSGDFLWYHKTDDSLIIALADCTGHGVPASLMTILGNTILNKIVIEDKVLVPGKILEQLDQKIIKALQKTNGENEPKDGMDIALININITNNNLQFAGAYGKVFIVRKSNLIQIDGNHYPIGGLQLEKNRTYTNQNFTMHEGDYLYLSSDGFADQFGGLYDKKFKLLPFKKTLVYLSQYPIQSIEKELAHIFSNWRGTNEQTDDVLVVSLKF